MNQDRYQLRSLWFWKLWTKSPWIFLFCIKATYIVGMVVSLFSKPLWHSGYVHSLQDHVSALLCKISLSKASLPLSLTRLL